MSRPPHGSPWTRGLEAYHDKTSHPCRNVLQALLGFSIALFEMASLDGKWSVAYIFVDEVACSPRLRDGADLH